MSKSNTTLDIDQHPVQVSNMDKVLYPDDGVDKRAILDYYQEVAAVMLPHLRDRPLVMRRYPDGIGKDGFFQKEASDYFPDWLRTVRVPRRETGGAPVRHVVCEDEASLAYLAGQACLEFHTFTSTAGALDRPNLLVVDIDPPDGADAGQLRDAARRVRDFLEHLGLTPFVQLTGGHGMHVTAPLDGNHAFDVVLPLARDIARELVSQAPERFTDELRKDRRGGRIFLDVNRNAYGQTAIAPYSLRARPGAPAAAPLDWSELGKATPGKYGIGNLPRRVARKDDPWSDIQRHAVSAETVADRLRSASGRG